EDDEAFAVELLLLCRRQRAQRRGAHLPGEASIPGVQARARRQLGSSQLRRLRAHAHAATPVSRPCVSGRPSIRFRFCTAAPAAPLPRLSSVATSSTWPSGFGSTQRSIRLVPFAAHGSKARSSADTCSLNGCTRTNGSPA